MPTPSAFFLSYLHYPSYDTPHAALLASLTSLVTELSPLSENGHTEDGPDMMLEILFSDVSDPTIWQKSRPEIELVWKATHGKMDSALDVWSLLQDVKSWNQQLAEEADLLQATAASSRPNTPPPGGSPKPVHVVPQKPLYAEHIKQGSLISPTLSHSLPASPVLAHSPLVPISASGSSTPSIAKHTPNLYPISAVPPSRNPQPRAQKLHNDKKKWNPSKPTKARKGPSHPLAESIPAYAKMGPGAAGAARWEDLRMSEQMERAARNEMLRKATRMYQSGNASNRGGEVAGFYADQVSSIGVSYEIKGVSISMLIPTAYLLVST